jgi:hypothetical protein
MHVGLESDGSGYPIVSTCSANHLTLYRVKLVWPSALRAWELLNGVKVRFDSALTPLVRAPDRHKRLADDAFGKEKGSSYTQREAFGPLESDASNGPNANANGVQDLNTRMMAHMLGLDVPAIEPSTSYYSGYEWWLTNTVPDQSQVCSISSESIGGLSRGHYFDAQPVIGDHWQRNSDIRPGYSYDLPPTVNNNFGF